MFQKLRKKLSDKKSHIKNVINYQKAKNIFKKKCEKEK